MVGRSLPEKSTNSIKVLLTVLLSLKQLIRYGITGFCAVVTHMGTLIILVRIFELDKVYATTIGFLCAMLVNFTMQNKYVFPNNKGNMTSVIRYTCVTLAILCLNLYLFGYMLDNTNINYLLCQLLLTCFIFVLNFLINKFFTFRLKGESD
jgi:putative flippase GtrA